MRRGRRVRWFVVLACLYTVLCTIGGISLADGALHPGRRPLAEDEVTAFGDAIHRTGAELNDVSITTADGVLLKGWMLRPEHPNGESVLVLHGLGDNRLGMSGYAQLFLAHGYTVLLPDARVHGASGGSIATYGLLERGDIHQWVEFLISTVHPHCVYGMAESMGAAQLLQALETGPRFCAVVAESPFSNFREIAYDRMGQPFGMGPWVGRYVLRPVVEIAFLRARWKYGLDMGRVSPEDAVVKSPVPVLLIHGQIDNNIPVRHSRAIHARAPQSVLWEVAGADHCGAIAAAPQEFESRVIGWYADPSKAFTTKGTKVHEGKL
jgi:pimeloyl-ACP methyl ester carboxylesterase